MRRLVIRVLLALLSLVFLIVAVKVVLHVRGVGLARARFEAARPEPLSQVGQAKSLRILPLADFHAAKPELRGEPGVSYLVETGDSRMLFDVGFNQRAEDPSPLEHNLRTLGISLDSIDTIIISHNHLDHVGGWEFMRGATFSIGVRQVDLGRKRLFVPVPMTYPGAAPIVTAGPTVIGSGVATIGAIPRQLFSGWVEEQALAIDVEGKGIVLVVGCGHQTLGRILSRTRAIFSRPLFGVIGGLHYPVPEGRLRKFTVLDVQKTLSSGSGPWDPIDSADVDADIAALKALGVGLVAVGGHDSSDEVIARFRAAFGPAYHDVRVGDPIVVAP